MTTLPRFSVIIPCYNNAETIGRAIRSALSQSYQAHEIIVVDDGSTDGFVDTIGEFKDHIRLFHQKNSGVSSARNLGAFHATGDWLAFLDADDIYYPQRLEKHAFWIADEPTIDFLLGDQELRTPEGKLLSRLMETSAAGRAVLHHHAGRERVALPPNSFESLIGDGFGEIRTVSIPRQTFTALGGFPTSHRIGEDLHLLIRLYAKSTAGGVTPDPLAVYYIHEGSALRTDRLRAMKEFIATLDSLEEELSDAALPVRRGYNEKRRSVRLSLAYAYLRERQKWNALLAVCATLRKRPTLRHLKDVISIVRGLPLS